jgi:hypothetical protein
MGPRRDELLLGRLVELEELAQHSVGRVEQVVREIVARVDEAGLEAAADAVDDGTPGSAGARLEREQVDVEDLIGHRRNATRTSATHVCVRIQMGRVIQICAQTSG